MLQDADLEAAEQQLSDFRHGEQTQRDALRSLLSKYQNLLEDYKALRSDYEEEKEGRERYKKLAKNLERKGVSSASGSNGTPKTERPYVLVLIDGDDYIFDVLAMQDEGEGGAWIAGELRGLIRQSLIPRGLADACDIVVRVYADFRGVRQILEFSELVKPNSKTFGRFVAGFNGAEPLFDFVDAGSTDGSTYRKIKDNFKLHGNSLLAEAGACKHIFLATCQDPNYATMLTAEHATSSRVTFVKHPGLKGLKVKKEFEGLGIPFEELGDLFTPLVKSHAAEQPLATSTEAPSTPSPADGAQRSRQGSLSTVQPRPDSQASHRMNGTATKGSRKNNTHVAEESSNRQGMIALNRNSQRLDVNTPRPSLDVKNSFRRLKPGPCHNYLLGGYCHNNSRCKFSHDELSPEFLDALRVKTRAIVACRDGENCRKANCYYGHVCTHPDAAQPEHRRRCEFPHDVERTVAEWVPAADFDAASTAPRNGGHYRDQDSISGIESPRPHAKVSRTSPPSTTPVFNGRTASSRTPTSFAEHSNTTTIKHNSDKVPGQDIDTVNGLNGTNGWETSGNNGWDAPLPPSNMDGSFDDDDNLRATAGTGWNSMKKDPFAPSVKAEYDDRNF